MGRSRSLSGHAQLADELGDPEEMTRANINLAEVLDQAGRLDEAIVVSRAGVAAARRDGVPGVLPILIAELADRLVRQGGWEEADAILPEAMAPTTSWGVGRADALAAFAHIQALRGDAAGAERSLREVDRAMREAVGSMWTGPTATARAEAAFWDGRPADALEVVATELGRREETDDSEVGYLAPVIAVGARAEAELAARARATGESEALADAVRRARRDPRYRPFPRGRRSSPGGAAVGGAGDGRGRQGRRGRVGRGVDDARRPVGGVRGALSRSRTAGGVPPSSVLAGGGPRGEVPAMLAAAYRTAERLQAEPLRREIADLARRARVPLQDGEDTAADDEGGAHAPGDEPTTAERIGLTARELDVLQLMAGGATNREIAARLYISQKTVTVHVTRILAKLDARTRVEAAGVAQRLGLLSTDSAGS